MRLNSGLRLAAVPSLPALGALLILAAGVRPLGAQIYIGQSFTAPVVGSTLLQQLTVGATGHSGTAGSSAYTVQIFAYSGSALVGSSLFSQSLGSSFNGYTLSPNITLTNGATYAVVVANVPGGVQTTNSTDTYTGGIAITCLSPSSCSPRSGTTDLVGFGLQFGAASTVPEPTTVALVAVGVFGVMGAARRRHSA